MIVLLLCIECSKFTNDIVLVCMTVTSVPSELDHFWGCINNTHSTTDLAWSCVYIRWVHDMERFIDISDEKLTIFHENDDFSHFYATSHQKKLQQIERKYPIDWSKFYRQLSNCSQLHGKFTPHENDKQQIQSNYIAHYRLHCVYNKRLRFFVLVCVTLHTIFAANWSGGCFNTQFYQNNTAARTNIAVFNHCQPRHFSYVLIARHQCHYFEFAVCLRGYLYSGFCVF